MCAATTEFRETVERQIRMHGMIAANDQMKHVGDKPRYVEQDFLNL